jgi:hypothetical protein
MNVFDGVVSRIIKEMNDFILNFLFLLSLISCNNPSLQKERGISERTELKRDLKSILFSGESYNDKLRKLGAYNLKDSNDSIAYGLGRTLLESKYSRLSKKTEDFLLSERLLQKAKEDSLDYFNFNFIGFSKEAIERPINLPYFAETIFSHPEFFGERIRPLDLEPIIIDK